MKILGITDEVTECQCCGRTGLKKTVILATADGEVRYGTACTAKAMGRQAKDVKRIAEQKQAGTYRVRSTTPIYLNGVFVGY